MLDQVKAAFPGAGVAAWCEGVYSVTIQGNTLDIQYRDGLWHTIAEPVGRSLEAVRAAWYEALETRARNDLKELRRALRAPDLPPTWPGLTFVADGDVWRAGDIAVRHEGFWRAHVRGYQDAVGMGAQEALTCLVQDLTSHHARYLRQMEEDKERAAYVAEQLAALGVTVG